MNPVRIRLYGLFPVTRQHYLTQVVAVGNIALVLFGIQVLFLPAVRSRLLHHPSEASLRFLAFWQALPWLIAALAALQVLEAMIVLRRFHNLEASMRSPVPTPTAPASSPISPTREV